MSLVHSELPAAGRRFRPRLRGRIAILAVMAAAVIAASVNDAPAVAAEFNGRPNVILCVADDHGWDETGYNGHPHLRTPVLDEMARSGLRFDRFYAAHPSCSPTRGSIITGRHPNRYGTFTPNWSIRPEEISIAHVLSKAGYACGHFGKWHLGPVKAASPTSPGAMGFEKWVSHDNFFEMNPVLSRNGGPPEKFAGESSEIVVEQATEFIDRAHKREQPFFAMICFGSPHEPYVGLEKDLALYDDLPASYRERSFRLTSLETGRPTTRPLHEVLQERYAEITAMDRALGQLREWLAENNLRENTLLWFVSDNGSPADGAVTSPFRGHKAQVYEGGIRVPSVIEWPQGIPKPRATDVNAVTSDILPTICDLLNVPLPGRPLDGVSLKPLIEGDMNERPRPIGFWEYDTKQLLERSPKPYIAQKLQEGTTPLVKMMGDRFTRNFRNVHHPGITEHDFAGARAILDNRYKLVVDARGGRKLSKELFDVREDPAEQNNLIEAKPEVAQDLERQLREWQQSVLNSLTGADYR